MWARILPSVAFNPPLPTGKETTSSPTIVPQTLSSPARSSPEGDTSHTSILSGRAMTSEVVFGLVNPWTLAVWEMEVGERAWVDG